MARTNTKASPSAAAPKKAVTHGGTPGVQPGAKEEFLRLIVNAYIFENQFYQAGSDTVKRLRELIPLLNPDFVKKTAIYTYQDMRMRHTPLFLLSELAKSGNGMGKSALLRSGIFDRPDQATEICAMYWQDQLNAPLPNAWRKTFLELFENQYEAYQLAKYKQEGSSVKLRDLLKMIRPKPKNDVQAQMFKDLIESSLKNEETWEARLSEKGADKKAVWDDMLKNNKLGDLALLRNIRNMNDVGVDRKLIKDALSKINSKFISPLNVIAAAQFCPGFEDTLNDVFTNLFSNREKVDRKVVVLVDVSGSMVAPTSDKSKMNRIDVACGLAAVARESFEDVIVYSFDTKLNSVPDRRGLPLIDAVKKSGGGGTSLIQVTNEAMRKHPDYALIVITDEQATDDPFNGTLQSPKNKSIMINVGAYSVGVAYGKSNWVTINGWSDKLIDIAIEEITSESFGNLYKLIEAKKL